MNKAERFRLASSVQDPPFAVRGCLAISAAFCLFAIVLSCVWSKFALLLAIPTLIPLFRTLYEKALLLAASLKRIRGVVVTSDSLSWKARIESEWLPRVPSSFLVLNWSTRHGSATLGNRLAWKLHSCFAGNYREYCPVVIVLRGWRYPAVFRFYRAFKESAQGRPEALAALESQLFTALSHAA